MQTDREGIEVQKLCKSFGNKRILEDVSFSVKKGAVMGLVGASGSGKTTLLRLIAGLDFPDLGVIRLEGRTMDADIEPSKRNLAMVFQQPALWNHMTVAENICYGMKKTKQDAERAEKLRTLCERLHMEGLMKRYPYEISGGEAKRAALARALAADKEILLLDEPLSNLDEALKKEVLQALKQEFEGKTVLYVTHDMEELAYLDIPYLRIQNGVVYEKDTL